MRGWIVLSLIVSLLLTGCSPSSREPDQLALVRVLGVEGRERVQLTSVCGKGEQAEKPLRSTCVGKGFTAALGEVPWSATQELSLTSVSYIIVGGDVSLDGVLKEALEHRELGACTRVWMTEERVHALLEQSENPEQDLTLFLQQGVQAPTVVEAMAAWQTYGMVDLPVLKQINGRLVHTGWNQWRK